MRLFSQYEALLFGLTTPLLNLSILNDTHIYVPIYIGEDKKSSQKCGKIKRQG